MRLTKTADHFFGGYEEELSDALDASRGGAAALPNGFLGKLRRPAYLPRAQRFYPAVPCTAAGNVSPARRGAMQRKLAAAPLTAISAAVSKLVT